MPKTLQAGPFMPGFEAKPPLHFGTAAYTLTLDEISELIELGEDHVTLLGSQVQAVNIEASPDSEHPVYFELTGRQHHYIVCIWRNLVAIDVSRADDSSYGVTSTMHPKDKAELRIALEGIRQDCHKRARRRVK